MTEKNTKFINSLFLKNLIENQYDELNVQIKKFTIESASGNDVCNTTSSMSRVLVRYSSQEAIDNSLSFVIKMKPISGELFAEFSKSDIFDKETQIYKAIVPKMVEILKTAEGKIEIAPDLIYSSEVPTDILIFEDLTNRGYTTEDPHKGLDYDQSLIAIEKLAFFHAASVIILNNNKIDFSLFSKGTFHESNRDGLKYFTDTFSAFIDNANNLEISLPIVQKLKNLPSKLIQKGIDDYTGNFNGFQCLNHGDFWTGNILFKYQNNILIDVIFVDYQNSVIGSPIIDLVFFLTSSVSYEILGHHRDELIFAYHRTLTSILNKLQYIGYVPSLNEFHVELLRRGALEVIYALTTAPYLRTPKSKINPAIQPALYKENNENDPKLHSKDILEMHKLNLQSQVTKFNFIGLLDWGSGNNKVKGLMERFQK